MKLIRSLGVQSLGYLDATQPFSEIDRPGALALLGSRGVG